MNVSKKINFLTPLLCSALVVGFSSPSLAVPKNILISLDGATPWILNPYLSDPSFANKGVDLLKKAGYTATQNITCSPSLTAACHISISTGSNTNNTDIPANTYHLVRSPFTSNISGFGGPIGGYDADNPDPKESPNPTATPIWQPLRAAGKTVVAATFPGADGVDVKVPGLTNSQIIQPGSQRTVDYTVPYGTFNGPATEGFALTSNDFSAATATVLNQLAAAGITSTSPVKVASLGSSFTVGANTFNIQAAAIGTTTAGSYDSLVFFDSTQGIIAPSTVSLPATGSVIVKASDQKSSPFYLGTNSTGGEVGTAFYLSNLAPDLSTVHVARYSGNFIPTNVNVASSVTDINTHVGTWANEPDFRITQGSAPGFNNFTEQETEAIYMDQVKTFVKYQTNLALRSIDQNPDADLVLTYIQQPDGSEHQFLITDPRQATDPKNPNSIGAGQDQAKITRYLDYIKQSYLAANNAVQSIIDKVGVDSNGKPNSNIIVVSDHGFEPFHTAVTLNNYLVAQGFDLNKVRAVTSGAAANIYINLQGRETNGTVSQSEYLTLKDQVVTALNAFVDTNPNYTNGAASVNIFDKIYSRPVTSMDLNKPGFGLQTNDNIGQDFGDVLALLTVGYNFDGRQNPVVTRLGDTSSNVLSVPSFYGAHGYDPTIPNLSAIFYAAGPDIGTGTLAQVKNIDIAPTINSLLGVPSASTVNGRVLNIQATPEPGTVAALGLVGLGALTLRRRKG